MAAFETSRPVTRASRSRAYGPAIWKPSSRVETFSTATPSSDVPMEPAHVIGLRREAGRQLHPVGPSRAMVKSPMIRPRGLSIGVSAIRPGSGTRFAMIRFSQSTAFGPLDQVLAEIVDLVDADRLAHRPALLGHRRKGVRAAEGRRLEARLALRSEIVDVLHAVGRAPDGALGIPEAPGRRRLQRAADRQLLVRIADGKPPLVVLGHLGPRPVRPGPVAEAGDVHRVDVCLGLALGHPLGQRLADAAALAEARHHRAGGPKAGLAGDRPDQRVAVRREGEGAVDDALDRRRGPAPDSEGTRPPAARPPGPCRRSTARGRNPRACRRPPRARPSARRCR